MSSLKVSFFLVLQYIFLRCMTFFLVWFQQDGIPHQSFKKLFSNNMGQDDVIRFYNSISSKMKCLLFSGTHTLPHKLMKWDLEFSCFHSSIFISNSFTAILRYICLREKQELQQLSMKRVTQKNYNAIKAA